MWTVMLVVILLAAITVVSCGASQGPVVVRVGSASITGQTVAHWAKAVALGKEVASSLGQSQGPARVRALDFLISANWLIGEASDHGLKVSDAAIAHRLQERVEAVPNGATEFDEEISSTGEQLSDVRFEIKAELAAGLLRSMVVRDTPPATESETADYYAHNRKQFVIPDLRVTDLIESIHGTRAEAIALGERVGPGRRFAEMAVHEHVARETPYTEAHRENGELVHTIFTARSGQVAGPVWFNHAWVLVVVRQVVPGGIRPLDEIKEEVATRLTSHRRHLALLGFIKEFREKWITKTRCRSGYVIQKCLSYQGPVAPEGNPLTMVSQSG
jgi:hypothetical protein